MIYLQVQVSDEDNGYAHVQVHVDPQLVLHLIAIKTGFTKDAALEPLQEPSVVGMCTCASCTWCRVQNIIMHSLLLLKPECVNSKVYRVMLASEA